MKDLNTIPGSRQRLHWSRLMLAVSAGLAAVAGGAGNASAQAKLELSEPALRMPARTLRCRSTKPDTLSPSQVWFRFAEGEELHDDRVIDAAFDASGAPLRLAVMATREAAPGRLDTSVGVYWFKPNGPVYGYRLDGRGSAATSGRPRVEPTVMLLPDTLASQARALGVWLWKHRCGKGHI